MQKVERMLNFSLEQWLYMFYLILIFFLQFFVQFFLNIQDAFILFANKHCKFQFPLFPSNECGCSIIYNTGKSWLGSKVSKFDVTVASFDKYDIQLTGYIEDVYNAKTFIENRHFVSIQIFYILKLYTPSCAEKKKQTDPNI